ncbi:RHS repeat-associated core domain-containing protein [Natroniella sp. ANB-PHB2]|uniref:RHS repeat-associated core domain-containing protein n=1 Tax=Natroniella sp. ANB-PHB2 TaxID=3384444 RepID=UPI0038D3BF81
MKYEYDQLHRIVEKVNANDTGTSYNYTPRGQVESIVHWDKHRNKTIDSYAYVYNTKGQQTLKANNDGELRAYQYDKIGRVENVYYPFNDKKKAEDLKERKHFGLENEIKDPAEIELDFYHNMTWDEESKLKEQLQSTLETEEVEGMPQVMESNQDLILSQAENATSFVDDLNLDYEDRNEIKDLQQEIGGANLNLSNQGFWREKFEYDPSGNVVSKQNGWGQINYEYNENNQLTQAGNRSYQYDKNGNLIREDLDGLYAQYEYNYENRLTSVKNNRVPHFHGGGTPFFGEIEYQYDALNRKVTKDIEAFSGIKKEVEHYIYDGLGVDILAEYRLEAIRDDHPGQGQKTGNPFVTGRLQRINEYYYGNGSLVAMHNNERPDQGNAWGRNRREPLRDVYFYHQDRLNSVRKTTGRNGEVVERYNYDAYGYPYQGRFEQNHRRSNPFGFTGKRHEVELGVHSFAYRHYNPRSMRWLTVDPIQDGLNWYQYVGGDPVNYVDPLGLQLLKAGEIREAAGMSTGDTDSAVCGTDESDVTSNISQKYSHTMLGTDLNPENPDDLVWANVGRGEVELYDLGVRAEVGGINTGFNVINWDDPDRSWGFTFGLDTQTVVAQTGLGLDLTKGENVDGFNISGGAHATTFAGGMNAKLRIFNDINIKAELYGSALGAGGYMDGGLNYTDSDGTHHYFKGEGIIEKILGVRVNLNVYQENK